MNNVNLKYQWQIFYPTIFQLSKFRFFLLFPWRHRNIETRQNEYKFKLGINMLDNDIFLLRQMISPSFLQLSTFLRLRFISIFPWQHQMIRINKNLTIIFYENCNLQKIQDPRYKKRAIEKFYASKNGLKKTIAKESISRDLQKISKFLFYK